MDVFAPFYKINGCFVVLNTSPQIKTISIFQYPINYGQTRDLLQIPGVAEQDIRASLLKGELNHKIRANDIIVICSDIDLLQFNAAQKAFLQGAGIVNGLSVNATPAFGQTTLINTSPYQINSSGFSIYIVNVNSNSMPITVNLPDPTTAINTLIFIKDKTGHASSNPITVSPFASENIDGSPNYTININYAGIQLLSDGTNWEVLTVNSGTV